MSHPIQRLMLQIQTLHAQVQDARIPALKKQFPRLPDHVIHRARRGAPIGAPHRAKWAVTVYNPEGWPDTFTFDTREEARSFRRSLRSMQNH